MLAIPLFETNTDDQLCWCLEGTGNYTVKSAYRLLQTRRGHWNMEENDKIWQTLWSIKAPPKVLNLVWRALSDCLHTLTQLHQKHVPIQVICPICQEEEDSIVHTLVNCSFARQCWATMFPNIQFQMATCFRTWLQVMFNTCSNAEYAEVVTLCLSIWRSRNDVVWNQRHTKIYKTVADAKQHLIQ